MSAKRKMGYQAQQAFHRNRLYQLFSLHGTRRGRQDAGLPYSQSQVYIQDWKRRLSDLARASHPHFVRAQTTPLCPQHTSHKPIRFVLAILDNAIDQRVLVGELARLFQRRLAGRWRTFRDE